MNRNGAHEQSPLHEQFCMNNSEYTPHPTQDQFASSADLLAARASNPSKRQEIFLTAHKGPKGSEIVAKWFERCPFGVELLKPGQACSITATAWTRIDAPSNRDALQTSEDLANPEIYNKGAQWNPVAIIAQSTPTNPKAARFGLWPQVQRRQWRTVAKKTFCKSADFAIVPGVWAEIDDGPLDEQRHEIERIAALCGSPFAVVFSGSKSLHAFWRFNRPLDLRDPHQGELWRKCEQTLLYAMGGDSSVSDPGREMRMPGFLHEASERIQPCIEYHEAQAIEPKAFLRGVQQALAARCGLKPLDAFEQCERAERLRKYGLPPKIRLISKALESIGDDDRLIDRTLAEHFRTLADQAQKAVEPVAADIVAASSIEQLEHLKGKLERCLRTLRGNGIARQATAPGQNVKRQSLPQGGRVTAIELTIEQAASMPFGSHHNVCPACGYNAVSADDEQHHWLFCHHCGARFVRPNSFQNGNPHSVFKGIGGVNLKTATGIQTPFGWNLSPGNAWGAVNVVQTPCGTAKSEAVAKYIEQRLSEDPGLRVLWVVARRSLAKEATERLKGAGFECYLATGANGEQYVRSGLDAENTARFVCCIDSVYRLQNMPKPQILVLDESTEILSKLAFNGNEAIKASFGATASAKGRNLYHSMNIVFGLIARANAENRTVFCCDAIHNAAQFELIKTISASAAPIVWTMPETEKPLSGKQLSRFEYADLFGLLLSFVAKGEPFALYCLTKGFCQALKTIMHQMGALLGRQDLQRIVCHTSENHLADNAGNDVSGAWHDAFAVVYNGSISSGISFKGTRFKHAVAVVADYGLRGDDRDKTVQAGARAIVQALQRCRGARHYWICTQTPRQDGLAETLGAEKHQSAMLACMRARQTELLESDGDALLLDSPLDFSRAYGLAQEGIDQDKVCAVSNAVAYMKSLGVNEVAANVPSCDALAPFDCAKIGARLNAKDAAQCLTAAKEGNEQDGDKATDKIRALVAEYSPTIIDFLHACAPEISLDYASKKKEWLAKQGFTSEPPCNPAYIAAMGLICTSKGKRLLRKKSFEALVYDANILAPMPVRTPYDVAKYARLIFSAIDPHWEDKTREMLQTVPKVTIKPRGDEQGDGDGWKPVDLPDKAFEALNMFRAQWMLKPLQRMGITKHVKDWAATFTPSCIEFEQRVVGHGKRARYWRVNWAAWAEMLKTCAPSIDAALGHEIEPLAPSSVTLQTPNPATALQLAKLKDALPQLAESLRAALCSPSPSAPNEAHGVFGYIEPIKPLQPLEPIRPIEPLIFRAAFDVVPVHCGERLEQLPCGCSTNDWAICYGDDVPCGLCGSGGGVWQLYLHADLPISKWQSDLVKTQTWIATAMDCDGDQKGEYARTVERQGYQSRVYSRAVNLAKTA